MKKQSIWNTSSDTKINNKSLSDNIVDIVIVGGGITGITLSYFLKDSNKKILLFDKGKINDNVTSRSTAKISFIQRDIYQKLNKSFNYDISKKYYESQIYAINLLKNIIEENKIDCDLEKSNSYLFTSIKSKIKNIEEEQKLLTTFGRKCYESKSLPIDFPVKKTFYTEDNYVFNPTKYLSSIIKLISNKISIYEDSLVNEIALEDNYYNINTSKGLVKSKYVVIANQYPFFIKPGFIPFKNYIKREYVVAGNYRKHYNFNAINIENKLNSIRFYKNYIIYVSNNHRITNKLDIKDNYQKSRNDFYEYFKIEPEYSWLNQDLMTNDNLPIIGQIKQNLYISTGYNAWGMTNSILGAKIISDIIMEKNNKYSELVNPKRISVVGLLNSIIDSLSYIKPYIETNFHKSNIIIEEENGVKYNVYIDQDGIKHRVKRKCPHLKCNLIFNEEEFTWDCPCHGSRFNLDGNLIEGPSKEDI